MWVKICANTRLEDALAAVDAGADAVGFVFAASSRQVTVEQVAAITARLPPAVERVGVFDDKLVEEIAVSAEQSGLTVVQLHGGYNSEFSRQLRARLPSAVAIVQTVHWVPGEDEASAQRVARQLKEYAAIEPEGKVLVDTKVGGASGGTGKTFDWTRAREVLASQPGLKIIVAGGLRPENVLEAVRALQPWGVDVASGVEREPGRKDPAKVKAFIENARRG